MPDIEKSLQQLLVTNFGLSPSGYAGSRGDTGYVGSGGVLGYTGSVGIGYTGSAAAGGGSTSPTITAITYPDNDTAAVPAGGQTVTLTGTNFDAGAQVIINGNVASVVSVVNSTTITFTAPPNSVGSYIVYVVNTNGGTALAVPGIQYSGTPAWTTAAGTLGTYSTNISITANLTATGDAPITYSLYSGTLPAGLTLAANTGVISGTTPSVASSTTYNFTVRSTDAQQQDTDRAFSIIVSPATPPTAVEYLVIAGGGGGGPGNNNYGGAGGGGAGGFLTGSGFAVPSGSALTVTVGAGGTYAGAAGGSSQFRTIVAIGGANGSGSGGSPGYGIGGSGSGAGGWVGDQVVYAGGAGTAGQGYNGGSGAGQGGGGGGGAGGTGGNGNQYNYGYGGVGLQSSITGTATYYAGGGAGGWQQGGPAIGGGAGGGGAGGTNGGSSSAGTANTGGGGGGNSGTAGAGGSGGSGVVIIRYPDIHSNAASTTGSPTATTSGGYKIYTWTTSGSITF